MRERIKSFQFYLKKKKKRKEIKDWKRWNWALLSIAALRPLYIVACRGFFFAYSGEFWKQETWNPDVCIIVRFSVMRTNRVSFCYHMRTLICSFWSCDTASCHVPIHVWFNVTWSLNLATGRDHANAWWGNRRRCRVTCRNKQRREKSGSRCEKPPNGRTDLIHRRNAATRRTVGG